ncbi:MAG: lactonase family protein [Thermomicrobiales bacterium]|nr:lactonase family protein [Thermomicrobiales bacterium]
MPSQFAYVGSDSRAQIAAGVSATDTIGISVYTVQPADGSLELVQTLPSDNAFFFDFDAEQRHLYGVNVIDDFAGGANGSVEAYARDPETGKLTLLNRVDAGGAIPAQPAVSPSGRWLVVANYSGANLTVFPIEPDGSLGTLASETKRTGSGPDATRQDQARPHAALFAPAGNFLTIADLGTDEVVIYALDDDAGQLTEISSVRVTPGAGPRHVAFDASGTRLYILTEMGSGIDLFACDPATGRIGELLQRVSAVPEPFVGTKASAEILIHPSGKFLYNSNRGQPDTTAPEADAIVGWRIDPETGLLTMIEYVTEPIGQPWSFAFDRSGRWLYAANYLDNTITQFAIDPDTGTLTFTGNTTEVPHPFVIQTSL